MNRGLFAITEGGFLVEKSHDLKTVIRYKANLTNTKDDFFIDLNDSELVAGETYYYRAYLNIGGSEVRVIVSLPWQNSRSECLVCKNGRSWNGWWRSDWFGAFSVHVNGWVYHADLGWSWRLEMIRKALVMDPWKRLAMDKRRVGLIYGSMKRLIGFIS